MDDIWATKWNQIERPPVHGVLKEDELDRHCPLPAGSYALVVPGMAESEEKWIQNNEACLNENSG